MGDLKKYFIALGFRNKFSSFWKIWISYVLNDITEGLYRVPKYTVEDLVFININLKKLINKSKWKEKKKTTEHAKDTKLCLMLWMTYITFSWYQCFKGWPIFQYRGRFQYGGFCKKKVAILIDSKKRNFNVFSSII
jgi:hypothetical protein